MNEKAREIISMMLVVAVALLLAFPFVPAMASDAGASEEKASAPEAVAVIEETKATLEEKAVSTGETAAAEERVTAQAEQETVVLPPVDEDPWEVTSLDISKDVDVVTAPGMEISLEKTASVEYLEMMLGDTEEVTFTIEVDAELSDSYYIAGNIFVQNTGEWPADVIAVSDTVWYKAGGPDWLAATSNITTTVPMGDDAIPTGGPHVYSYSGTFTLPVPLASVTSMSNLIEITISNKPDPPKPGMQDWKYHYRQDFAKPADGASTLVSLEDIETIEPSEGLSYEITSVTINGSDAGSLTGPWELDLAQAPFTIVVEKDLTAGEAGSYILNNKARIGEQEDDVDVEIVVKEPDRESGYIEGNKYVDLDADGELDEGEPGLAGVTIKLYKVEDLVEIATVSSMITTQAFVAETVTDENGHFEFLDLEAGEYLVEEVVPEGYYATSQNPVTVWVVVGQEMLIYFLNARMARASGEKIDATTQEGVAGVEFVLEGDGFYEEILSDENGEFDFGWLMPGEYHLHEIVPEGWVAVDETEFEITLESGDERRYLFANMRLSGISGTKWLDLNANGQNDEGEDGLAGVTINLRDAGGNIVATTVSGADGSYAFEGLVAGEYTVEEIVGDGYVATGPVSVTFDLSAGENRVVDFFNNVQLGGEVVIPPAQTEAGQTLPVTGFEMSLLLVMIGLLIMTGVFIASYGLMRMIRTR
jgi:hypothetical protein